MKKSISQLVRDTVKLLDKRSADNMPDSESPYQNIPFFQTKFDPSETSQELQLGPPSEYNDPDRKDRLKNVEDIRQNQGIRPEKDVWYNPMLPVTVTNIGEPWTDAQGEPTNNTTRPGGRNENRDTIGWNEGQWTDPWCDSDPSGWNDPTR
jgi:hypothetical protein